MPEYAPASHTFRDRAKAQNLTDHQILNSNNPSKVPPTYSDVTSVGAGIHSLIYAIHTKKKFPNTSISLYEKQVTPGYKIGESALTPLGLWMVNAGIPTAVIIRIFGVKDGLAFYYFNEHGDPEDYGDFCANGPPATWVPTFQMERKISEMILTLLAQRNGIDVYHGTPVEIDATVLNHNDSTIKVKDVETQVSREINSKVVIDGTGRFRRLASKEARLERFEGWNTDAFWAYFDMHEDETEIAKELRCYESCNTNHICVPEGWAWVIRLPSWEGSSTANLMDMLSYLLDLAEKDTPGDQYPSANKLAEMFDLKLRWVVSIGFALRTDTKYPADLTPYGTKEAEQKFNWIVAKYPKVKAFMKSHTLIEDLYGPKTTWFVRKQLAYRSPKAYGAGWIGVGDAVVFSNPLFSPGINANMSFSVKAAEMTKNILSTKSLDEYNQVMQPYADYAKWHGDGLVRLNKLNYVCMRHPKLGPVSNVWTYLCGQGNKTWQRRREFNFDNQHELIVGWIWGAGEPVFTEFAEKAFKLLEGTPDEKVSDETVAEVLKISDEYRRKALAMEGSPYKNNWAGLLRFYDKNLERVEDKTWKDLLARRCTDCGNWNLLREDWLLCVNCTHPMTKEVATIRPVSEDGLLHDPYA